jgi:tetratricopeptide (TPR) repeat protein
MRRDWTAAESWFQKSLAVAPRQHLALANLGRAYHQQARWKEALATYRQAVQSPPVSPRTAQQYAWLLATVPDDRLRDGKMALEWVDEALQRSPRTGPELWDTLAAAYAADGKFDLAVKHARHAARLARKSGEIELATQISRRLEMYQEDQPYLESVPPAK